MLLKQDCIFFPGDRPCRPHKTSGVVCDRCTVYQSVGIKILIIKLDALGDVLRTTSILHALAGKYPGAHITWLTKKNARDIFTNNPLVNDVWTYEEPATLLRLGVEAFDVVINLDPSPVSATLATATRGKNKIGFGLDEKGKVYPFNREAETWFEMGAFDHLKKANVLTYQEHIHRICSLPYTQGEIIINLTPGELTFRDQFIRQHGLQRFDFIVGINSGASERWQYKKWRDEGFAELILKVQQEYNCAVLLYGGPGEAEVNGYLSQFGLNTFDTGSTNTLREFFALIDICHVLITGDTLALHVGTALRKEVICLFGPTSYHEIEDYGRIRKVKSDLECLVCYKTTCSFMPNCMSEISVEMIYAALQEKREALSLLHNRAF